MKSKKPRQTRIGLDFKGPTTITGMRQNEDGSITFFGVHGEPLSLPSGFSGSAYDRPKGPKVTFQIPEQGQAVGSLAAALRPYNHIVGVDTNSCTHHDEIICVSAICEMRNLNFEGLRWSCTAEPLWALEFHDPTKSAERIGWRHALSRGSELGWLNKGVRTLLVVDAFLDELHQINERKAALVDDFVLPHGVSIAYASSDAASDSPLNGLIARCDQLAREILKHVIGQKSELRALIAGERTPFRAHRYWTFEVGQSRSRP